MAHLSSPDRPWGKPFTNKLYLHPPFAENIVTLWPSSMVLIGEIPPGNSRYWYEDKKFGKRWTVTQPSAGVIFTLKRNSDLLFRQQNEPLYSQSLWDGAFMPIKVTKYRVRKDGVPIHGFTKDLDAFKFHQEAFCDPKRVSTAGTGRTWYTTWAEHSRYTYYKRSGNREKCKMLVEALLKYNVTTEYCQCERYDDHDAYTAPWMPNASANGRVLDMLFDCYGKKEISSSK